MVQPQTAHTMPRHQRKKSQQIELDQVKKDEKIFLEIFNQFDADLDGFLSMDEFREFMISVGCDNPSK